MLLNIYAALAKIHRLLIPHRCPACFILVDDYIFCNNCRTQIDFLRPPWCQVCGMPGRHICDGLFSKGRSVAFYSDPLRRLILQFKHNDATHLARFFAPLLKNMLNEFDFDYVVPIPLHRWRLFYRQYNQSSLLAMNLQCDYSLQKLYRIKHTSVSKTNRPQELNNAFIAKNVQGDKILLLDDVWTTGATFNACCKTLWQAGARDVMVLSLARTGYQHRTKIF